ncbi:corrinoid adenosyltransferase MMAB-like [Oppia nitens]|uniref:corrinoid adenosyltransferase MMAB-like n=1 Tax=Oppia nitens TaxID=1686743 RepID=UPI0023DBA8DE|nr:corrinoid adenosyltransferase MMAB-like [Oppia nitens]
MDFITILLITMSAIISLHFYRKFLPQNTPINHFLRLLTVNKKPVFGRQLLRQLSTNDDSNDSEDRERRSSVGRMYTRTGDNGSSGLFGSGDRRPKNDNIFEALGVVDELSSSVGFAREFVKNELIDEELERIQCILQELQSNMATPKTTSNPSLIEKTKWNRNYLIDLELSIDSHTQSLPQLKNFILPSGGKASSALHMSRAICRRAERKLVPLLDEGLELPILQYLNRLSSYLFTIARVCALNDGKPETIYTRQKSSDDSFDES